MKVTSQGEYETCLFSIITKAPTALHLQGSPPEHNLMKLPRVDMSAEAKTPILEQWLPQMDNTWKEFIGHAPEQL